MSRPTSCCGRGAELVAELEQLVAAEPLRERLRGQLMLALYRAGRQGEALDAYRDAVRTLDAELGLQPGPELERLQQAILAHDPGLLQTRAAETPPQAEQRRATATILCAELADFAAVRAVLGDADADRVRVALDGRARDALAAHGATAVTVMGDGFVAAFSAAGACLACAVELQRAVARQARLEQIPLELRVGVGAGDVAWAGDDYSGTPVVEAQRLCGAAPAGGILVAETVRLLAGSGTDARFEDAGELELRGLVQPVRAWSVGWTAQYAVAVPFPASLAVDGSPVFVGREPELAGLRAAWDDAVRGRRRGVFVSGEPGIGKTRLAAEIARHAREREGVVLYGRCDDGLAPAAQPFAQALGAYAAACPVDELRVQLDGRGSELLALLPDLAERVPGLGEPAPAEPDVERLRMLDAAGALLAAAGSAAPVLLVLDDMHWADELSLLLLRHVLRADAGMRLLVLATYRDTEPSRSPLLADVVAGLARRPDVARVELGPLAEPDIATILEHAGRRAVLAAEVRDATEGNPFFVREMLEALSDGDTVGAPLTPRVRDIVRWRLGRLPEPAADVLAVAAVIGAEFDADVLADAIGIEPAPALDALEAAERARLVRPAGKLDRFTFAHALVRETIADELPAGRRVRLHARIAHALERSATTRVVAAGDLAAHFDAAGSLVDAATTLGYARAAGDEAAARFAFDVAAEQYERALRAYARLPSGEEPQRLDLELERGRALSLAGDQTALETLRGRRGGRRARRRREAHGRRAADTPPRLRRPPRRGRGDGHPPAPRADVAPARRQRDQGPPRGLPRPGGVLDHAGPRAADDRPPRACRGAPCRRPGGARVRAHLTLLDRGRAREPRRTPGDRRRARRRRPRGRPAVRRVRRTAMAVPGARGARRGGGRRRRACGRARRGANHEVPVDGRLPRRGEGAARRSLGGRGGRSRAKPRGGTGDRWRPRR